MKKNLLATELDNLEEGIKLSIKTFNQSVVALDSLIKKRKCKGSDEYFKAEVYQHEKRIDVKNNITYFIEFIEENLKKQKTKGGCISFDDHSFDKIYLIEKLDRYKSMLAKINKKLIK